MCMPLPLLNHFYMFSQHLRTQRHPDGPKNMRKSAFLYVRRVFHLGDHPKVMSNLRGLNSMKCMPKYIVLIQKYQRIAPLFIRAFLYISRDYNKFTHHLARIGRHMKHGYLSSEDLDVIIKNRFEDFKSKNISQGSIYKFVSDNNSYILFTNKICVISSVISIGKERPRQVVISCMKTFQRLQLETDSEDLVERQTLLNDKDIQVLGVDAQRRLSKSHVLVSEMGGTAIEFCKKLVVAGVGSLTLMDDRMLSEGSFLKNFFSHDDEDVFSGKSLAEACCDALREFNPVVQVSVQKGDLSSFDEDFYDKFTAVIVSCCSLKIKRLINEKCRRLQKPIGFYTVDCWGSLGEIFVDLQNYTYSQESSDAIIECQLQYPSFEEAVEVRWSTLPRRLSKLYFANRVIENFEEAEGRRAGNADLQRILTLKKELCEGQMLC